AAKNFRDVFVVVDPIDYPQLLTALDGPPDLAFRFSLMLKAFAHTGEYDTTIATTLLQTNVSEGRVERAPSPDQSDFRPTVELVDRVDLSFEKIRDLRYGENPHQKSAWYGTPSGGSGFSAVDVVQGKELSFTNLLDLDAPARIAMEFPEPAAVVV